MRTAEVLPNVNKGAEFRHELMFIGRRTRSSSGGGGEKAILYLAHLNQWLRHSDARQVYDLPVANPFFRRVSDPRSQTVIDNAQLTASCRLAAHQSGKAIGNELDRVG